MQKCTLIVAGLSFLLIVLISLGCKRKMIEVPIDKDLVANFNYLPGSYWIYKDSITGRVDSFYVTNNSGITSTSNNNVSKNDQVRIIIQERNINHMATDTAAWYWTLQFNTLALGWESDLYSGQINTSYGLFISYPFNTGVPDQQGGTIGGITNIQVLNIDSSYSLNGDNYTNVAEIFLPCNTIDTTVFNDLYYFNADAGIIKMRLDHPHFSFKRVWELQQYKIMK